MNPLPLSLSLPSVKPSAQIAKATENHTIDKAHETLLPKTCTIVEVPDLDFTMMNDAQMQVWQVNGQWIYQIYLLGQCFLDSFDSLKDAEIIVFFDSLINCKDRLLTINHDLGLKLSRSYLKLSPQEQTQIVERMRSDWPASNNRTEAQYSQLLYALLLPYSLAPAQPSESDNSLPPDLKRVYFKYHYLTADTIDDNFKQCAPASIASILQFNRFLLLATLRRLDVNLTPDMLPSIPEKYHVPCGTLLHNNPTGLNPANSDLFTLMLHPEKYNLDLLSNNDASALLYRLLHFFSDMPSYKNLIDDLLLFNGDEIDSGYDSDRTELYKLTTINQAISLLSFTLLLISRREAIDLSQHVDLIGHYFSSILEMLSSSFQALCIQVFSPYLKTLIPKSDSLHFVLTALEEPEQNALIDAVSWEHIKKLIQSSDDLLEIIRNLQPLNQRTLISLLGWDHIKTLIHDGDQLGRFLLFKNERYKSRLIEALGWKQLTNLVKTYNQLKAVLSGLSEFNQARLLHSLGHDTLTSLIKHSHHLTALLFSLRSSANKIKLIDTLGTASISKLCFAPRELISCLQGLDDLSQTRFIEAFGWIGFQKVISSEPIDSLTMPYILKQEAYENNAFLCASLGSQTLRFFIQFDWQLIHVLRYLTPLNQITFLEKLGNEHLQNLFNTPEKLRQLIKTTGHSATLATLKISFTWGCSILSWANTDEAFHQQLLHFLEQNKQQIDSSEIYFAYLELLIYILNKERTKISPKGFFSIFNITQKLNASKWLLGLLTKEILFNDEDAVKHQEALNHADLRAICQNPHVQESLKFKNNLIQCQPLFLKG